MKKLQSWCKFIVLKILQTFNIDLLAENKNLLDRVSKLESENAELKRTNTQHFYSISERELPLHFTRERDNLLVSPDGTKYCWNCYNKREGGEYRVLNSGRYHATCNVCGISTELERFVPPPQEPTNNYGLDV